TFALFLLYEHFLRRAKGQSDSLAPPLLVSFVEAAEQVDTICKLFGFDFGRETPVLPVRFESKKPQSAPDLTQLAAAVGIELTPGSLVLVDGVSVLGTKDTDRRNLQDLIDQIRRERLFAVMVAEEYSQQADIFLEYAVDGIIRLGTD